MRLAKTRLFSAGEMIFTMLFRQYFGGWSAHLWRNRIDVESCVGINALGSDWNKLARTLKRNAGGVIAGDFSNYDASLCADVLWATLDIVEAFYENSTAEERNIRMLLWSDVVNSWHVNGNTIYLWNQSNPSGCPVTSVLNSVVHSVVARMAFLLGAEKCGVDVTLLDFERHIVHVSYGDDDVWSVGREVNWCTQEVLTEAFAELGMTYTDEQKLGVRTFRTLEEVKFLKRGFRYEQEIGRWVGPLDIRVVMEMPNWIHRSADPYTQTAINLETANRELALHPLQVYKECRPLLEAGKSALEGRVPCILPRREEILRDIINAEKAKTQRKLLNVGA